MADEFRTLVRRDLNGYKGTQGFSRLSILSSAASTRGTQTRAKSVHRWRFVRLLGRSWWAVHPFSRSRRTRQGDGGEEQPDLWASNGPHEFEGDDAAAAPPLPMKGTASKW